MHLTSLPSWIQVFKGNWLSSNSILLLEKMANGKRDTVLIDTGFCTESERLRVWLTEQLEDDSLGAIVNTHLHSDHCGANAHLQAMYPRTKVYIPKGQAKYVIPWDAHALDFEAVKQPCPVFTYTHTLQAGQRVVWAGKEWHIYAAPGHDPHALILFEPQTKVIVTGDALWQNGLGVIFPELLDKPGFDAALATLDTIEQLQPNWVIPGHGAPFTDAKTAIDVARGRLQAFKKEPSKHHQYAVRALLKFHLLYVQRIHMVELASWAQNAPLFECLRSKYAAQLTSLQWIESLVNTMAAQGTIMVDGDGWITN